MNSRNHCNRVIALVIGLLMVSASFGFLCFQAIMMYKTVKAIEAQEAFLQRADIILNSSKTTTNDSKNVEEEINFIKRIIPDSLDNADILNYLQTTGSNFNLDIIALAFEEEEPEEGYRQKPVRISIQGQYQHILGYITELRNGTRPFKVAEVKMERANGNSELLYCEMLLFAFAQKAIE